MLSKYRIRATKAISGQGSVDYRIKATAAKKIQVTRRSKNVWEGYENYRWAEDKDGNPKGEPDHAFSDTMDAVSYAVADINPVNELITPRVRKPREKRNVAV
jgi:phage terminase large subunit